MWEARWDPKTFTVLTLDAHRIDVPFYDFQSGGERAYWEYKRYSADFGRGCGWIASTFPEIFGYYYQNCILK
jgi:hypothetical protein